MRLVTTCSPSPAEAGRLVLVMAELLLRPLRSKDDAAARLAHEVLGAAGYNFFLDHDPAESWAEIVGRLDRQRRGIEVAEGRVPAAFLVAWVGEEIVGRVSIRFELNEYLASAGGHIGYAVLPAYRRHGYGTEILRQALVVARASGVADVLVTCAIDNVGSRAIIERCGGEFESVVNDPRENVEKRRYWIR